MNSLILVFHVITMVASMGLMSSALVGVLLGSKTAVALAKAGTFTTIVGSLAGAYLLILHPAAAQCAILITYLTAVGLLYRYLFAMGNTAKCAWVRERS